ncbi:DNA repair protein Rad26 [Ceratocystis lukuohia]|uniref:DNA repair protein Rad26 n=1 Tax=Ceratocystis lukuohia TaxID=2019550 RepID=A0ABR4MU04_9PEZI
MEFDEFDDDELDDLTDGALLELEQQAIQATQAQAVGSTQQPQSHAAAQSHAYSTKPAAPYVPYNYNALAPGSRHLPPQRNPAVSAMPMRPPPGGSVRPQLPPKQQQSVSGPVVSQLLNGSIRPQPTQFNRPHPTQYNRPQPTQFNRPQPTQYNRPQPTQYSRPPASQSNPNRPFVQPYPSQQTKSIQLSQQSQQPYQSRPAALHASQAYAPNSTLPLNVAEVDTSDALELQRRISLLTQQLNSAKGETAIVRSKLERTSKDHEVSLAAVRQRHDAQISTFKQTLEAAQTAEKIAKTELKFLQQELRDSDSRNRRPVGVRDNHQSGLSTVSTSTSTSLAGKPPTTPRKATKTWALADGFDDIDLAPSPGKRASRSVSGILPSGLERTPTKNKRKRNVLDSPVPQLDMEDHGDCGGQVDHVMLDGGNALSRAVSPEAGKQAAAVPVSVSVPVPSFDFLKLILDHEARVHCSTLESLFSYHLPSRPHASLGASILHSLPTMGSPTQPLQVLADFASHIISLLGACVDDEYPPPFEPLATILGFTLRLHTWSIVPALLPNIVPTIISALTQLFTNRSRRTSAPNTALGASVALLELLHLTALGCSVASDRPDKPPGALRRQLWSAMTRDVVVLGLSPRHWTLPGEIVLMLDILATSGLNESIGPISADMEPSKVAAVVFERITKLLTLDAQALIPGPTPHNHQPHNHVQQDNETEAQPAQLRAVHMAALRTLLAFSQSDFGIRSLAADPHVTRRVAIILTTAVEALYCVSGRTPCTIYSDADLRLDPSTGQGSVGSGSPALGFGAHELDETATVIDLAMSILYRLVTYGSSSTLLQGEASEAQSTRKAASSLAFDLRVKLSSHGYEELEQLIVALSRLNFADEELFYEARIDPETGDKAMRVLDFLVSPQEGSDIAALFYTQAEAEAEAEDGDEAETEAQAQAQGGGKDDGMKTGDKRVGPSTAANPGVAEVISIDDD